MNPVWLAMINIVRIHIMGWMSLKICAGELHFTFQTGHLATWRVEGPASDFRMR
jgi:hypothetical protein